MTFIAVRIKCFPMGIRKPATNFKITLKQLDEGTEDIGRSARKQSLILFSLR